MNLFYSAARSNAQGGGTLADEGTTGKGADADSARPSSRPSSSNLRRPTASTRPAAARPVPRATTPSSSTANAAASTPTRSTTAAPPPDVDSEGFDRSEKLLFLGGAILVVIIAAYGAYALLSAGSGKSSNVTAGASAVTTTTTPATTTTTGDASSTSTETTVTTEATPDTTTDTPVTTTGGGGTPTPTTTPPPVPTTLPSGVRPIVQVTPRSGDRLVIPHNSDINNVNPGVTAGKISIVNAGSSPGGYYVTAPTGTNAEVLKSLRIRIVSGGQGTLAGGGSATVVVMLQSNPTNDQGTPVGEAQPGDTGQLIIRGLGADIVVNYVVG